MNITTGFFSFELLKIKPFLACNRSLFGSSKVESTLMFGRKN